MDENKIMNWLNDHIIIGLWTGTNEMSESRRWHFEMLKQQCGCQFLLITADNLDQYLHPDHPLHPAYPYLSETHKSDYLRAYFMHFFGGGYCDIKMTRGDWNSHFEELIHSDDKWICGYQIIDRNHIACDSVRDQYLSLIGVGAMICKPQTPITTQWYNSMVTLLDEKLEELKQNPSSFPQDRKDIGSSYPLYWNEICGRIFHYVVSLYIDNLLPTLPQLHAVGDYR